jgi:hypothetical protein
LIERESARRLARLGGSEPDLATVIPAAITDEMILVDTLISRIPIAPWRRSANTGGQRAQRQAGW